MKCIKCDEDAEYICMVFGTGGSYCKTHLAEFQSNLDELGSKKKPDEQSTS